MRYANDVVVESAIMHVLDTLSDEALLNMHEIELNDRIYEFIRNQITKSLNDFECKKGKFYSPDGLMYKAVSIAFNEDEFIESSRRISKHLFRTLKKYDGIESCNLILAKFSIDEQSYLALLKLDYQTQLEHNVEYKENELLIELKTKTNGLPGIKQKVSDVAFFKVPSDDEFDMLYKEKPFKTIENEYVHYFKDEFLQASEVTDDLKATTIIKNRIEKWIRKNLKDDIDRAEEVREYVNDTFLNSGTIDVCDFISNVTDTSEEKEILSEEFEKFGLDTSSNIDIDKHWVEKKLKAKNVKTDTGFSIKGDYDFFNDSQRFELKHNGDGSVNYIIKNIRNCSEK